MEFNSCAICELLVKDNVLTISEKEATALTNASIQRNDDLKDQKWPCRAW